MGNRIYTYLLMIAGVLFSSALLADSQSKALIAVASNFYQSALKLETAYESRHPDQDIQFSFGSSGKLFAQIQHGAPFHAFLSADSDRPIKHEKNGLGVKGSRFTYAIGKLALWSNVELPKVISLSSLQDKAIKHIAIANPKHAPYGSAAKQVLTAQDLWPQLSSLIVRGDSIAQTYQFVATQHAQIGFVSLAQLIHSEIPASRYYLIPETLHTPIEQQALLLTKGTENKSARGFLSFLKTEAAHSIISAQGYRIKPDAP